MDFQRNPAVSFYIDSCTCLDDPDSGEASGSDNSDYQSGKQVVVGICAMEKKSLSKPMKEILTRIGEFEYIKTIIFPEDVILNEPIEKWPLCDCLIAFHSRGFPLEKTIQYKKLRKPYIINDLEMQFDIQDRRTVYKILEGAGIEIPRYAILDRSSEDPSIECDDHVEVNGVVFNKPFVEKPVSAEDHNIFMYYPASAGGGSQRLFRKIGSRSSVYSSESSVRKAGSYIYEDFMPTDGTDVKVYTVGPDYAHAEARKSPALDGKVERDSSGKEVRYPVILSNREKLIARKVCMAFKQTVCGFDLLRANGKSIVCDVNGFSFVKNSSKYYDDSAKILGNMILRELAPTLHIPWTMPFQLDDPPIVPTTVGKMMELRCVVAVIRHGDRTPKQKMKLEVKHSKFFEIFGKYDGYKKSNIKLKKPKQLQEILDIARDLLEQIHSGAPESELIEEKKSKLEQIKNVLEMYGHFSGINRKVQLKYQPKGRPRHSSSDDETPREASLLLILKWGGELTPSGRRQAEELGKVFRCMYPGGQGEYAGTQGLGLLRLHSTYRHDLKIYASDEGRVQMTAAAFAKGLLALEGELTPILVQMVKSANTNGLLDNDNDCSSKYQNMVKAKLFEMLQMDRDFTQEDEERLNPSHKISIANALKFIRNPVRCCEHIYNLIKALNRAIEENREEYEDTELYHGETWELMVRRWAKLEKDFLSKTGVFDISKIPDIYDCIKYDLLHNISILQLEQAEEIYTYAKNLADVVIPQEYGMTRSEKLTIAQGICAPLLRKIRADLQRNIEDEQEELEEEECVVNRLNPRYSSGVSSPGRHVRTRLYFTSESHIHSLLTILSEGGLVDSKDEQWQRAMEYVSLVSELNYMTQVVIMLYEDPTKDPSSDERFHVELHFSPGVNCCVQKDLPPGPGFRPHSRNHEQSQNTPAEPASDKSSSTDVTSSSAASSDPTSLTEQGEEILHKPLHLSNSDPISPSHNNNNSSSNSNLGTDFSLEVASVAPIVCSVKCSSSGLDKIFSGIGQVSKDQQKVPQQELQQLQLRQQQQQLQQALDDDPYFDAAEREESLFSNKESVQRDECDFDDLDFEESDENVSKQKSSDPISISSPRKNSKDISVDQTGSYPGSYQQARSYSRARSLEKRGSRPRSLESTGNPDSDGLNTRDPPSKSQSMDEVGDEDSFRRAHRHSIPGHRLNNYLKFLNELAAKGSSTAHLFSTAVISGSSSAPNLKEMPQPREGLGLSVGFPSIRPLETLHNALSLRQLDFFLEYATSANFKTPCQSPPRLMPRIVAVGAAHGLPAEPGQQDNCNIGRCVGAPSYIANCESSQAVRDLYNRIILIHQSQQLQEQKQQQQEQQRLKQTKQQSADREQSTEKQPKDKQPRQDRKRSHER